jgi:hypothetical protein
LFARFFFDLVLVSDSILVRFLPFVPAVSFTIVSSTTVSCTNAVSLSSAIELGIVTSGELTADVFVSDRFSVSAMPSTISVLDAGVESWTRGDGSEEQRT